MSSFLIDTDWVIDVLNDIPAAIDVITRLSGSGLGISLVTYGELYQGIHLARDRDAALRTLQEFLIGVEIIPLTLEIMERFAIVRARLSRPHRQQIGDMDLLIAATAIEHDLILLTRNIKDFQLVPDLRIYTETAD